MRRAASSKLELKPWTKTKTSLSRVSGDLGAQRLRELRRWQRQHALHEHVALLRVALVREERQQRPARLRLELAVLVRLRDRHVDVAILQVAALGP